MSESEVTPLSEEAKAEVRLLKRRLDTAKLALAESDMMVAQAETTRAHRRQTLAREGQELETLMNKLAADRGINSDQGWRFDVDTLEFTKGRP